MLIFDFVYSFSRDLEQSDMGVALDVDIHQILEKESSMVDDGTRL